MNYFLATKNFISDRLLHVISIALVGEDGREYYALNSDCDLTAADPGMKLVIDLLPEKTQALWKTEAQINADLLHFIHGYKGYPWYASEDTEGLKDKAWFDDNPIVWVWQYTQDYTSLEKLFTVTDDFSAWLPLYCNYVLEEWNWLGSGELPEQPPEMQHNALVAARWTKEVFQKIRNPYKNS
ncbi:hypothetical protein FD723_40160 (plasmid) [Nostoc sp. C052]|uniref:3'-5' exoribonuclease n=1 Tax=Nostoc sp. C052 TaxID=2576902 RepID=UPI0015C3B47F|nr:3'-5' exoribonuclease [Nostoc sp. C052]QLE46428.1 hypothetical protein FD723_40160 [Nostoc sp. C052]